MNDLNHSRRLAARLFAAALLLATAASALAEVHYVDVNSTNATPPYTNWTTAATNIQDAVDAAVAGDEIVVTNGIYATGGRNNNRVAVDKPLGVQSVNGPTFTTIYGSGYYCVYLTNNATLSGFTLTHGDGGVTCESTNAVVSNCVIVGNGFSLVGNHSGSFYGGGAYGGTLNHCTLVSNQVTFALDYYYSDSTVAVRGGGAAFCTLNNCTLIGNSVSADIGFSPLHKAGVAWAQGGGAYSCTLNNCALVGNSVRARILNFNDGDSVLSQGGGAFAGNLNNSIVYFNTNNSLYGGLNYVGGPMNYCCTTPDPGGVGNITNAPLFVDQASGNLRLQSNSPCINAGNNSYVTNTTDLDGNPRISGGTVDIGAYEYQWPQLTIAPSGPNVLLRWPTNNAGYDYTGFTLQSTTNLGSPAVWVTNLPAPVVVNGQNTVTNPISGPRQYYRLSH